MHRGKKKDQNLSQDRDAAKKPTYRVLSQTEQPISSGIKLCRPKAADIILMPTKLRKRDTALMDSVDSFSNETDEEINEAGVDCNYKPTKK